MGRGGVLQRWEVSWCGSCEGLPALSKAPLSISEAPKAQAMFQGALISPFTELILQGGWHPSRNVVFPGVQLKLSCAVALLAENSAVSVTRRHVHRGVSIPEDLHKVHSQPAGPRSKTRFLTGFLESLEVKFLERLAQRWEGVWLCTNKRSVVGEGREEG